MKGLRYDYGIAQGSSFRVRRGESASLLDMIDAGQSIHVTAGRRLGKTVLLQQIREDLEERNLGDGEIILPVYQDLQIISQQPTASILFGALSRRLSDSVNRLLHRLSVDAQCPKLPDEWRNDPSVEFLDFLNLVLDSLDRKVGNIRLICLLDECEALLGSSMAHTLLGNLRALTGPETYNRVQIVATGFRDLKEYQDPETGTSPFTNVLLPLQLGLLQPDEFRELLSPLLANFSSAEQGELIRQVWFETGGHPCLIHTLCAYILESKGGLENRLVNASALTIKRLRGSVFSSWLNQFRPEDHELFRRLLQHNNSPEQNTPSEEFLLYCGVVTSRNGSLQAPCGLFNKWYRDISGVRTFNVNVKTPKIKIPKAVEEAYQDRRLVVFAGSGLSLGQDVGGNFPAWRELPFRLIDACERYETLPANILEAKRAIFESSLPLEQMLAELDPLRTALGTHYQQALNEIFRPKDAAHGAVHEAIINLNVRTILTTNYDQLLEMAGRHTHRQTYTWKDAAKALADLQAGREILLKVHGSAEHHDSVVMSSIEYSNVQSDLSYQDVLKLLLQDQLFLFVGYGMNDPLDLDMALKGNLRSFREASRRHYVLLKHTTQQDIDQIRRNYNVQVIPYTEHEQVTQFLLDLAKTVN